MANAVVEASTAGHWAIMCQRHEYDGERIGGTGSAPGGTLLRGLLWGEIYRWLSVPSLLLLLGLEVPH